ncbi:MAG: tetratricopeptide (TPR) repeat protein, partial [Candidatus Omnitrophota bacterium]
MGLYRVGRCIIFKTGNIFNKHNVLQIIITVLLIVCIGAGLLYTVAQLGSSYNLGLLERLNQKRMAVGDDWDLDEVVIQKDQRKLDIYKAYYQNILQQFPTRADAYGLAGYFSYQMGDYIYAYTNYTKAVALNKDFYFYHYNLAASAVKMGKYEEAFRSLMEVVSYTKEERMYQMIMESKKVYLPLVLNRLKHNGETPQEHFVAAYNNTSRYIISYLSNQKQYDKVIQILPVVLARDTQAQGFYYFHAGVAYFHLKDFDKAIIFLKRSMEEDPQVAEVYQFLA